MLSKSKFIGGLQCEKRLWLEKHQPDLRDPLSDAQQALFSQGTRVGELAQSLFPGGVDCTPDFTRADRKGITIGLNMTKEAVRNGADVIYEAAFVANGVYAAMDILVREGKKWRAIEVKSSTGVKGYHIYDVALQYYVLTQAGIDLVDIELMHINNEYVRQGDLDVSRLFNRASLLEEVRPLQSEIPDKLRIFLDLLEQDTAPEIGIGPHCGEPFECPFKCHCWEHVPNQSVFNLTRIGSNAWKMYEEGLLAIEDVPEDYTLTNKQRNQVAGVQKDKEVFNAEAIAEFLGEWKFPLYFFDFETIGPAVPLYDKSRPYEHLPFQYSLHILSKPDAELTHVEFLADPEAGDPRQALITQMLSDLKKRGSIVTYNMSFEKGKITALADAFPEHKDALLALNKRIVDLLIPFRNQWCYQPSMNGSASIKAVLPALTSLSYKDLEIQEGGTASDVWQAMAERKFAGEPKAKMEALRKYCERDTLAMVEIYKVLGARG
ncbi:MAG: DUF2779 domain-containing protein [Cryomorphaceae bacterium]